MVEVRALAVDAVVPVDGDMVLLDRDRPPFEGCRVLPGGLVEPDGTAPGGPSGRPGPGPASRRNTS